MEEGGTRVPEWVERPFEDASERIDETVTLLLLATDGISNLKNEVNKLEKVYEYNKKWQADLDLDLDEEKLERVRERSKLAEREVQRGFPILYSQSAVIIYSILEGCVHNFVSEWICNEEDYKNIEAIRKISIPFVKFEELDSKERSLFVAHELDRKVGGEQKKGITRFEEIFKIFGLGKPQELDEETKNKIFELQKVRNIIVHRRGIADKTFEEECPWLGFSSGQEVVVGEENVKSYFKAVELYLADIIMRIRNFYSC